MKTVSDYRAAVARCASPIEEGVYRACCNTRAPFGHSGYCAVPVLEEAVEELERTKAMLVEAQVAVAVATTLNPAWVDLHERIEAVVGPERA